MAADWAKYRFAICAECYKKIEYMGCSGNGEHRVFICYFLASTENIPESIEERNMNRKQY